MRTRAACWSVVVMCALWLAPAAAQLSSPVPEVTADNESWYLGGAPIDLGGVIYYPTGPVTHFNRNEMVFTGFFERVPVFKRTTQEPGSVLYVPLAGGLVRPYERRRSGELAGTVGSTAPSFPVVLPAADTTGATGPQFFGQLTPVVPRPVGTTGFVYGTAEPHPVAASDTTVPAAVGTIGAAPTVPLDAGPVRPGPARVRTVQRPAGLNAIYVEYQHTRWFAAGPAIEPAPGELKKVGEYHGFAVYKAPGQEDTIYVATLSGQPALLVPYKAK